MYRYRVSRYEYIPIPLGMYVHGRGRMECPSFSLWHSAVANSSPSLPLPDEPAPRPRRSSEQDSQPAPRAGAAVAIARRRLHRSQRSAVPPSRDPSQLCLGSALALPLRSTSYEYVLTLFPVSTREGSRALVTPGLLPRPSHSVRLRAECECRSKRTSGRKYRCGLKRLTEGHHRPLDTDNTSPRFLPLTSPGHPLARAVAELRVAPVGGNEKTTCGTDGWPRLLLRAADGLASS